MMPRKMTRHARTHARNAAVLYTWIPIMAPLLFFGSKAYTLPGYGYIVTSESFLGFANYI